jgi:hypothetical protein
LTQQERAEEKLILKRKKLEEKKREKLKSIRIQLALLRMDREIKKSLTLDNTVSSSLFFKWNKFPCLYFKG